MNSGGGDFDLCGWRVASEIALPELPPWRGDDRLPEIAIVVGDVAPLVAPTMISPLVAIDAAGCAHFSVDGVADFAVTGGCRITVAPVQSPNTPDVRLFLLGSGLGYLCHQRGVLPLHGATVDIDGAAIVLTGPSGAGKSTLADAFSRRGHPVLSDDVSPVQMNMVGAVILPSLRRIRLWQDSIDNAGWDSASLERCREGLEKFSRSLQHDQPVVPLPPSAVFHLRRHWEKLGGTRFRRLRGRAAADELRRQVYRWRSLVGLAGPTGAVARVVQAASHIPNHFVVERPLNFTYLDELVDEIVMTVRATR